MFKTSIRIFVALLCLGATTLEPAFAGNGQGHGGDKDRKEKSDKGKNDHETVGGNGNGGGNGNNGSNSGPASQQDEALDSVETGRAIPLESLIAAVRKDVGGEILDAQLVTVNNRLLYQLAVLDASGQLRHLYFDAKTGQAAAGT